MNLFNFLLQLNRLLRPSPYLLMGGMAYSVFAEPRFTEDIDLMISEKDLTDICGKLKTAGYINQKEPWIFEKAKIMRSVFIQGEESLILDLQIESDKLFQVYYERRQTIRFQDTDISVIHPEDLIELKERRNSIQDKADIGQLKTLLKR